MRLVVTGGREYCDTARIFAVLDDLHARRPITLLIEGEASGVDKRCAAWARRNDIPVRPCPAPWDDVEHPGAVVRYRRDGSAYDVTAGLRRNQQMLDEGRPDYAIVFPGGSGTADMKQRIIDAGIEFEEAA